jgi:hypothetical protein
MSQTAVCNRHHSIDQQLSRWLLMSLDRLHSDELLMTPICSACGEKGSRRRPENCATRVSLNTHADI